MVQLKKYLSHDSLPVVLSGANDQISYPVNTGVNQSAQSAELFFTANPVVKNADGSQLIKFVIQSAGGEGIVHEYIVKNGEYAIDWNIGLTGADRLLSQGQLNMQWHAVTEQHERTAVYERQMSNVCFSEGNDFDYISAKNERKFEKPVQWLSFVQQFFNTTLIAKTVLPEVGELAA